MNGEPEDLSGPLLNRFEVVLDIDSPCKEAIEALPEDLRPVVVSSYSNKGDVKISYRELVAFSKLREVKDIGEKAFKIIFGSRAEDLRSLLLLGERSA